MPLKTARRDRPLRAIYVEDDADLREVISWILTEDGVELTACGSAEEALKRFEPEAFDLVLTDVCLSQMSGIELADEIHNQAPSIPIVFASSRPPTDLARFGPRACALTKPFTAGDLTAVTRMLRADLGI